MSQLQIADHGAVTVASLRLPQVHTYTISTYPLLISSDTPEIVCLHVFAVRAASRASYQRIRSARPRNMPTNSGSRVMRRSTFTTLAHSRPPATHPKVRTHPGARCRRLSRASMRQLHGCGLARLLSKRFACTGAPSSRRHRRTADTSRRCADVPGTGSPPGRRFARLVTHGLARPTAIAALLWSLPHSGAGITASRWRSMFAPERGYPL